MRKQCPLCLKLLSGFRKFIFRIFGFGIDCYGITQSVNGFSDERVSAFNEKAPDCVCEKFRTSKFSPRPVENKELLVRFIFSPMLINKKNGKIKPNGYSHVSTKGCSIQRDSIANDKELVMFVEQFLSANEERSWKGVVLVSCSVIRSILSDNTNHREVCVYDTASQLNPAHGELFQTQYVIEEADKVELREKIFRAFGGNDGLIPPLSYREGFVFRNLSNQLQLRV